MTSSGAIIAEYGSIPIHNIDTDGTTETIHITNSQNPQQVLDQVVSIYLKNLWNDVPDQKSYLTLNEFSREEWPRVQQSLATFKEQLGYYRDSLTTFTLARQMNPDLTPEEFYARIPEEVRIKGRFHVLELWTRQYRIRPTVEELDKYIAGWPSTVEEGYNTYWKNKAFAKFTETWTRQELAKLQPAYAERVSTVALAEIIREKDPKISDKALEKRLFSLTLKILHEARLRIVINRELPRVSFKDENFKTAVTRYWQEYLESIDPDPVARGILPWSEIK